MKDAICEAKAFNESCQIRESCVERGATHTKHTHMNYKLDVCAARGYVVDAHGCAADVHCDQHP